MHNILFAVHLKPTNIVNQLNYKKKFFFKKKQLVWVSIIRKKCIYSL